jgi:hypothetical protein
MAEKQNVSRQNRLEAKQQVVSSKVQAKAAFL